MKRLFEKVFADRRADEAREAGIYPYFHRLESRQDAVAVMKGKRRIMRGRRYDIKVNGEEIRTVAHALVTRMPRIAGGLRLALPPFADDEYALWLAKDVSRFGCLRIVWNLYCGKPSGEV